MRTANRRATWCVSVTRRLKLNASKTELIWLSSCTALIKMTDDCPVSGDCQFCRGASPTHKHCSWTRRAASELESGDEATRSRKSPVRASIAFAYWDSWNFTSQSGYSVNRLDYCNALLYGRLLLHSAGALNLQGIDFARKGGGNCKERNIPGKAPQFASVWICKEWTLQGMRSITVPLLAVAYWPAIPV